ncbi:MAG: hypothetical protein E7300_03605 [Lachnospiraceae bacterium]|nr:hypothetical protein [Lachnospiraceae bacterium]
MKGYAIELKCSYGAMAPLSEYVGRQIFTIAHKKYAQLVGAVDAKLYDSRADAIEAFDALHIVCENIPDEYEIVEIWRKDDDKE